MPSSSPDLNPPKPEAVAAKVTLAKETPEEMQSFAQRFSKEDWIKLCAVQDFLDKFTCDIAGCRVMAEKILAGKYKPNKA